LLHPRVDAALLTGESRQEWGMPSGVWLAQPKFGANASMTVRRLDRNNLFVGGFNADGTRFVAADYSAEAISIHRWPDGKVIEDLLPESVFSAPATVGKSESGFNLLAEF